MWPPVTSAKSNGTAKSLERLCKTMQTALKRLSFAVFPVSLVGNFGGINRSIFHYLSCLQQ
jgi:hypothetical protein